MIKMTKRVCVIGAGYVGLPLICLLAKNGYNVFAVDIDKTKVKLINKGVSPLKDEYVKNLLPKLKSKIKAVTEYKEAVNVSDILIMCVPTPIDNTYRPDLRAIVSASENISPYLKKGQLVIIESTVAPGTTEECIKDILEKSGLKAGKDFYLAHCPERIDPGNKKWTVENIPRVVGGINKKSTEKAYRFYKSILNAEVHKMSSAKSAEAVKIVENTFRDVNIAFVNELAKSFNKIDIDTVEVIKGASTKPFGFLPHYPGCGVGGHCIAVDPYYLIEKAEGMGFEHRFLKLAREINNSMPEYTVQMIIEGLNEIGKSIKNTDIAVLGVSYKGGVADTRESPALKIIEKLRNLGARLKIYDPYVKGMSNVKNIDAAVISDCLVIATNHPEFRNLDLCLLKSKGVKVIVDGRNIFDKEKIKKLGIIYKGIGR